MKFHFLRAINLSGALLMVISASPVSAGEVHVVVNGTTGEVAVAGNAPDSGEWLRSKTAGRGPGEWVQIFGDDEPGWASVSCSLHDNGQYNFQIATGHPTEAEARRLAIAAAEKHLSRSEIPGKVLTDCGYTWNNANQPIALGPSGTNPERALVQSNGSTSQEPRAENKRGAGSGKLSATPIGALAQPILINGDQVFIPNRQPGVPASGYSQEALPGASSGPAGYQVGRLTSPPASTPNPAAQAGEARLRPAE